MPSASTAVIAGSPSRVAGILMKTLGRSTVAHSDFADAIVAVGVLGQPRVDLDGDASVHAVGAVVDGPQDVGGLAARRRW